MMPYQELISNTKWNILKELSKGEASAIDIAKKINQSTAHISQQLKLLEAYDIIKICSEKKEIKKAGKPKKNYSLNQEFLMINVVSKRFVEKKVIKIKEMNEYSKFLFNTTMLSNEENKYAINNYLMTSDMILKAESIGFLKTNKKEIELFIISKTEHLKEIRDNHCNKIVNLPNEKSKKVISWSHDKKEIKEGLYKKENYFINLIKNSTILYDKNDFLKNIKQHKIFIN